MIINLEGLLVRDAKSSGNKSFGIWIIHTEEHYDEKLIEFESEIVQK